jgi:uncharacterized protein (TIGR03083 family)
MDRDEYLGHLAQDGRRMAEVARGDLKARVPTCPAWTLAELIEHTGGVHRYVIAATRERTDGPPDAAMAFDPASGEPLADWFQAGVDEAVHVLSALAATEPRWTWFSPDQTAGWYFRRIAQETLVHRIDAELAAGVDVPDVAPAFAVDGIDEMCDVFIPSATGQPIGGDGQALSLQATDADRRCVLVLHADHVDVTSGRVEPDAVLRARARDLLLMMWGRDPLGEVEQGGDASVIATFLSAAKLG